MIIKHDIPTFAQVTTVFSVELWTAYIAFSRHVHAPWPCLVHQCRAAKVKSSKQSCSAVVTSSATMGAPAPGLLASMTQIHGLAHVTHTAATLSPCSCDSSPEKAAEGFRFDMSSCKDWFAGYLVQKHVCIYIVLYIYIYISERRCFSNRT